MKAVAVLLVALAVYAQANDNSVAQKWSEFQTKFGKTYRSPVEANRRFAIFKEKLAEIDAHNALFEQGKVTYTKGINQFSDWTRAEFGEYVNIGLANKPQRVNGTIYQKTGGSRPSSLDWRQQGVVTEVKDQGDCYSSWAFSTTGSTEGQLAINQGKLVSLSEQNLIACSEDNLGCANGKMQFGFEYIIKNGINSEADYPFVGDDDHCKFDSSKVVTKLSSYVVIAEGDEDALVDAVVSRGPVSVAMDATSELQDYQGGILDDQRCGSDRFGLDHGVLLVGYGSENGQDYYIIKNSWGKSWGENGYFKLIKDNNRCGVATDASIPQL